MAELKISEQQNIHDVLNIQGKRYIIPEYQRLYRWGEDECGTLWDDIVNAKNNNSSDQYFLGTIVTCIDNDGNREIIDGQQRLTSFFLLLRAFYCKLKEQDEKKVANLLSKVSECIWDTDMKSGEVTDSSKIHIESKAIDEKSETNKAFHQILIDGKCDSKATDNYSKNYRFFIEKSDEFAKDHFAEWDDLCAFILYNCVILPIECNEREMALTIFNTLNDRGMPLSDADIFKAKIYQSCKSDKEKQDFITNWNEIDAVCKIANIDIDRLFRYYMHKIRAYNGDKNHEIDIRDFYEKEKQRLTAGIMSSLTALANFWMSVNTQKNAEDAEKDDKFIIPFEAKKWLHCLSAYPNELWQYPVSVFYLKYKGTSDTSKNFCRLLKQLIAMLFVQFVITPTRNAIREDVYNAYIAIAKGAETTTKISAGDVGEFETRIHNDYPTRMEKPLLLLDAYLNRNQTELIQEDTRNKLNIEHICPRKWKAANYNGWLEKDAQVYLEKLGNKVIFEEKPNIQAGNGYFARKREKYQKSRIAAVLDLAALQQDDWLKEDIDRRESELTLRIVTFIKENLPPSRTES